jgi:hypothetical protein
VTDTAAQPSFSEWCILELMGHRRLAGKVTECQVAGQGFLRLDVPAPLPEQEQLIPTSPWTATQFYSPSSVYCMTPVTEATARKIALLNQPTPATRWELTRGDGKPADDDDVLDADFGGDRY